jgi:hypothetical protein
LSQHFVVVLPLLAALAARLWWVVLVEGQGQGRYLL